MYSIVSWTENACFDETREREPDCSLSRILRVSPCYEEICGYRVYDEERKVGTVLVSLSSHKITKNTLPGKCREAVEGYFLQKLEEYKKSIAEEEFDLFYYLVKEHEVLFLIKE